MTKPVVSLRTATGTLSSNAVLSELTNVFVTLPRRPSGEVGPAAIARFGEVVRRLDSNSFPVVARATLAQANQSTQAMLRTLLTAWVKVNLSGARQFALVLAGEQRDAFFEAMVFAWARQGEGPYTDWLLQCDNDTFKLITEARWNPSLSHFHPTNGYRIWLRLPEESRKATGWNLFTQWASKDPAAAVTAMAPHTSDDRMLYSVLRNAFSRWVDKDTDPAVSFVATLDDNGKRRDLIAAALPGLGKSAPRKALDLVRGLPEGANREELVRQLMIYWAATNPKEAFGVARSFPEGPERKAALAATLGRVAGSSPDLIKEFLIAEPTHPAVVEQAHAIAEQLSLTNGSVVFDWASRLPPGKSRDTILLQGITGTDFGDPRKALALVEEHLSGVQRHTAVKTIFRRWTSSNPAAAAKGAEESPEGPARFTALAEVAAQWASRDLDAAAAWVLSLPENSARQPAEREIVRALSAEKPARAAEFAGKLRSSGNTTDLVDIAVRRWAELDVSAAVNWLKGHPGATNFGKVFGSVARAVTTANPPLAAELAERASPSDGDYGTRHRIGIEWAKQDPEAATKWVARMISSGDDNLRSHFHSVFAAWARSDPPVALAYVATLSKSTNANRPLADYRQFQQTAISLWSEHDPAALLGWLKQNSTGRSQTEARQWVLAAWARRSPADTFKWLNQLSQGEDRAWSVAYALPFIAAHQPDLALRGLDLVPNVEQRERVMESVYRAWAGFDEHGARSWLQTNSLPASNKERLLKEK